MISFLKGTIAHKSESAIVIEIGGVGYELSATTATLSRAGEVGAKATVFTYMAVREDAVTLYGFHSIQEKEMFLKLTSVSGIGAKMAVAVLSGINTEDLAAAITSGNTARLSSVKGIGKKTAERIVLELKDKLGGEGIELSGGGAISAPAQEAVMALVAMGFTRQEAESAVAAVKQSEKLSVEEIIIHSLKGR